MERPTCFLVSISCFPPKTLGHKYTFTPKHLVCYSTNRVLYVFGLNKAFLTITKYCFPSRKTFATTLVSTNCKRRPALEYPPILMTCESIHASWRLVISQLPMLTMECWAPVSSTALWTLASPSWTIPCAYLWLLVLGCASRVRTYLLLCATPSGLGSGGGF